MARNHLNLVASNPNPKRTNRRGKLQLVGSPSYVPQRKISKYEYSERIHPLVIVALLVGVMSAVSFNLHI